MGFKPHKIARNVIVTIALFTFLAVFIPELLLLERGDEQKRAVSLRETGRRFEQAIVLGILASLVSTAATVYGWW